MLMTPGRVPKMAEFHHGGPIDQRMHTQSTTSNSVPSTPMQQPRDLRFRSNSPSPTRRGINQSPQSMASEAIGLGVRTRGGGGGVCRFESGAEIRKRRIPYVDGGNEELGPPKKEPRKSLNRDERTKLAGDMRELYDRLLPTEESEQRRVTLVHKLERILQDEYSGKGIAVNVFGSSGNLLSSTDSDVDICITTTLKSLNMHALAELLHRHGMEKVVCRASAKVPIVKCWDPELKLAADLGVNNTLALENTRMIRTYVLLDERVRPLASIIKYWTKRRILNDAAFGGTISSYTWICMIISFLQRRDPPILPSLQNIKGKRRKRGLSNPGPVSIPGVTESTDDGSPFADDVDALRGFGNANTETQADLLFQFFRHYGYEFDYSKHLVSIRAGRLLTREEKGWHPSNYADKEARNRLCVEEPFTINRNLGNSADDYAWSGIHAEIRRAFDLLADGCQLDRCCEEYEFPPEEVKMIFQRPAPKPKPILTRSVSQSGRSSHEQGGGRNRRPNNRTVSSQRSGSRRASSGATFNTQHLPQGFPPGPMTSIPDYFGTKGSSFLHEQLASQWQYLQAQAELLQQRLTQQQLQVSRAQAQAGDLAGSPHHPSRQYPLNMLTPQLQFDGQSQSSPQNTPLTAPIPSGYMYHYPPRFAIQQSPLAQSRARDGPSTNPSSPSLSAAVPLRRQIQRGSIPDGSSTSARSQSQPGRSLPLSLSLSQHGHLPYEALNGPVSSYLPQQHFAYGPQIPQPPYTPTSIQSADAAMPKEYVGYYVSQSPQLGPQYGVTMGNVSIPPVALRDPPASRSRRVTPELLPPFTNGRLASRSPSPLDQSRDLHPLGNRRPSHPQSALRQTAVSSENKPAYAPVPTPSLSHIQPEMEIGGPLIVNGSNSGVGVSKKPTEKAIDINDGPVLVGEDESHRTIREKRLSQLPQLSLRGKVENIAPREQTEAPETPSRIPPSPRPKPGPRLQLSSPPNGAAHINNNIIETFHSEHGPMAAPLLSPVAEMRTPSPTQTHLFERDSPQSNGLMRAAQITVARQNAERAGGDSNEVPNPFRFNGSKLTSHIRKSSAPEALPHIVKSTKAQPTPETLAQTPGLEKNVWQQATGRKGHKKSKSSLNGRPLQAYTQQLPENETERKGG